MIPRSRKKAVLVVLPAFAAALFGFGLLSLSTPAAAPAQNPKGEPQRDPNIHPREHSIENLKKLGLAMHNFNSANGSLPAAASYGKDGKPLLSWRVALLPYLGQKALYDQFKLDQPWDSEHNKKLLDKMPNVYTPLTGKPKERSTTYYQVLVGKGTAFEGKRGLRIPADFPDGTSNTILIVEAGAAVPWTKPADVPYDQKKPLPKLGGLFKDGFHVTLCDGSVRLIGRNMSEQTLRDAITRDDGNVLGADW
jgi:Protein of unknown function (DUF1559)